MFLLSRQRELLELLRLFGGWIWTPWKSASLVSLRPFEQNHEWPGRHLPNPKHRHPSPTDQHEVNRHSYCGVPCQNCHWYPQTLLSFRHQTLELHPPKRTQPRPSKPTSPKAMFTWKWEGKVFAKSRLKRGMVLGQGLIYMERKKEGFSKKSS